MNKLIIGLIIGLIVGAIAGYFLYGIIHKPNFNSDFIKGNNFQIDEQTKADTISFFDSNPNDTEIEVYCQENPMNCGYYCMEINPNHEICDEINMPQDTRR